MNISETERFERHFLKLGKDDCWEWMSAKSGTGYGRFMRDGKSRIASRESWRLYVAPVSDGQGVLHKCDNRACVNPNHLYLGDMKQNMRDCCVRGRKAVKLTASDVLAIRQERANGAELRQIAERFGVSVSMVSFIALRKKWNHV